MTEETTETPQAEEVSQDDLSLSEALEREWAAAEARAESAPPVDEPAEEEPEAAEAASADDEPQETPETVSPPEHWSAEEKEAFSALPGEAQEFYKRIAEHQKGDPEADALREAFDPVRDYLSASGVPLTQAASTLVQTYIALQSQPLETIQQLAKAAQVEEKLREAYGPAKVEEELDTYVDPEVAKLRKELRELKDASTAPTQPTGPDPSVIAEIRRFREEKDEAGELKRPHFDKVYPVMASLMQSGAAKDLDDAYGQAIWSQPDIRQAQIDAQLKERQKQANEEAKAKAAKAKKAATTVNGKGSTTPEPPSPQSLSESLRENWDKSMRGEL